eukprot:750077-Hanusia_phi.AAC.2
MASRGREDERQTERETESERREGGRETETETETGRGMRLSERIWHTMIVVYQDYLSEDFSLSEVNFTMFVIDETYRPRKVTEFQERKLLRCPCSTSSSCSNQQLNYIRDTFAAVSRHINRDQFEEVFLKLQLKPTLEQIDEVIRNVLACSHLRVDVTDLPEQLWQKMDTTNCGQVDIKDFTRGLTYCNATEMADFKRIFGTQIPPWLESDDWPLQTESLGTQLRINCLQTRLSGTGELFKMLIEKLSHLEVCRSSLMHEVEALKPSQERVVEIESELRKEREKTKLLESENESLVQDLNVLRRMVVELGGDESSLPQKRSAFTKEQEHILHELQEQVMGLVWPLFVDVSGSQTCACWHSVCLSENCPCRMKDTAGWKNV